MEKKKDVLPRLETGVPTFRCQSLATSQGYQMRLFGSSATKRQSQSTTLSRTQNHEDRLKGRTEYNKLSCLRACPAP
eukprot:200287-Amphidinium_carterae.1